MQCAETQAQVELLIGKRHLSADVRLDIASGFAVNRRTNKLVGRIENCNLVYTINDGFEFFAISTAKTKRAREVPVGEAREAVQFIQLMVDISRVSRIRIRKAGVAFAFICVPFLNHVEW